MVYVTDKDTNKVLLSNQDLTKPKRKVNVDEFVGFPIFVTFYVKSNLVDTINIINNIDCQKKFHCKKFSNTTNSKPFDNFNYQKLLLVMNKGTKYSTKQLFIIYRENVDISCSYRTFVRRIRDLFLLDLINSKKVKGVRGGFKNMISKVDQK